MKQRTPLAAALALWLAMAVTQAQQADDEPTLEERIDALEAALTRFETRFEARTTPAGERLAPGDFAGLEARVSQLEAATERLAMVLQRIERQTESALREAIQARREAATAERMAREASLRGR